MLDQLLACTSNRWSPGIGDPSMMGWGTVIAYLVAVALCVRATRNSATRDIKTFWGVVSILLILLAVNEQLDLQSAAMAMGKCLAWAQDWYEERRTVQLWAVIGLICFIGVAILWLLIAIRHSLASVWPALLGLCFLAGFIILRAADFHHVTALSELGFETFSLSQALELAGIAVIALNAGLAGAK